MDNVHKIGLGTVQFGLKYGINNTAGQTSVSEVSKILNYCLQHKICFLDTAFAYGNSEEVLGNCGVQGFSVISKFIIENDQWPPLAEQFETTLSRLNTKQLYGYLAHRPQVFLNNPTAWEYLQQLKASGKILKTGFSLNSPEEALPLLEKGLIPDLVQIPYNYFDKRFESLAKELKSLGCEIHSRSSFLQGLFFMESKMLPDHFSSIKHILKDLQKNTDLQAVLLSFCISKDFIDKTIIGVETLSQLQLNIESLNKAIKLPDLSEDISIDILTPSLWPKF